MMFRRLSSLLHPNKKRLLHRCLSSSNSKSLPISRKHPTHVIFGANTDVGKTVVSTSLIRSNLHKKERVNYIKPLQSGGGDESFITNYVKSIDESLFHGHTLFQWDMPASPHLASREENKPVSDEEVLTSLKNTMNTIHDHTYHQDDGGSMIWIETAGGVLSPASASPSNTRPRHAKLDPKTNSGGTTTTTTTLTNQSWGWSTQSDLYQPLHLPVVLVGDGKLGGISATLSALESLLTRGYDVHSIVLIEDSADISGHGSNLPALKEYASRCMALRSGSGRALLENVDQSIVSLPSIPSDINVTLHEWFDSDQVVETSCELNVYLRQQWEDHVDTLSTLRDRGNRNLWWPFTQHQGHFDKKVNATVIDGASGDNFSILHDKEQNRMERTDHFDACASWWTQGMGHGEASIGLAAAAAAGRFGHVIFPDVVHEPATELADILVNSNLGPGQGWASRVFFSDDGSTAMEVAIKMGMKKYAHDHNIDLGSTDLTLTVCAQKDCYHGDTLGVMDVAEPSIFNEGQHPWYEPKGLFLPYPTVRYRDGTIGLNFPSEEYEYDLSSFEEVFDVNKRLSSQLYQDYKSSIQQNWEKYESQENSRTIGSVVIEPLLLGAGGMRFIDPLWQRALMDIAKEKRIPVIFDEVAAGLYRLGVKSCREILKADPDVAAYAKLLTGGLVPMSVTLASEDVFQTFLGDSKGEALLHGHSYTAHPVGCVTSIHALETYHQLYKEQFEEDENAIIQHFDQEDVLRISKLPLVQESMSFGTVLAVTIEPESSEGSGYAAASRSIPVVKKLFAEGVYARPLGNVVYIMVSPLTSKADCSKLCEILAHAIESTS